MAESEAILGYGTFFELETAAGSGVFEKIAEATSITPPTETTDSVEVTHMESEDQTREFIPGLIDPGELGLDLNWIPGSDTDELLRAWRERRRCRLTFPNDVTWTFTAFKTSYSGETPMEGKMAGSLTAKVSGSILPGVAA